MAETCEIPPEIVAAYRKFKLSKSKTNNAMICKINAKKLIVEEEDVFEDLDWEDIQDELPESTPRYIIISYRWEMEHDRVSFPLVFLYYAPRGINPKMAMLYSSTKARLQSAFDISKSFDLNSREELTEENLVKWLKK